MLGATVTVGIMIRLFKPRWLDDIQPVVTDRIRDQWLGWEDLPEYPPSKLTACTVSSSQGSMAAGSILDGPARSREAQAAREARKAARREEQRRGGFGRMDAKAERRAAREARRIMMDIRRRLTDAFTKEDM